MSMTLNERNTNIMPVFIGTQASTITLPVGYFRKHSRIKFVDLLDQAGISASNSNYLLFSLQDSSSNVYATYDTRAAGQGAVTANSAAQFAIPSPDLTNDSPYTPVAEEEIDVPAGTQLNLVITANGTVTTTKALLQLEYYPL